MFFIKIARSWLFISGLCFPLSSPRDRSGSQKRGFAGCRSFNHAFHLRDTPFSIQNPVSRTGSCAFYGVSCRDTPFSAQKSVSRSGAGCLPIKMLHYVQHDKSSNHHDSYNHHHPHHHNHNHAPDKASSHYIA